MSRIPDLVKDAELKTRFETDRTVHIYTDSGETARERSLLREEHWERIDDIGSGSYGSVWLENRVRGKGPIRRRAVKKVIKAPRIPGQKPIDYHRELEAISKFSHRNYERCFVKSFGWYQNNSAVFIAMEYLEHGDLHHYLHSSPVPLTERDAKQVCYQVLEGLKFMHENGYAHRDVKPGNILLKSKPPEGWWVKLSDFGISKRAEGNNPAASSHVQGTLGYMAPELFDFVGADRTFLTPNAKPRSNAKPADVWAVGEIVFQMLTKEPAFRSLGGLAKYAIEPNEFPSIYLQTHNVSVPAISFIRFLMEPEPEKRLTAANALAHCWLEGAQLAQVIKRRAAPKLSPQAPKNSKAITASEASKTSKASKASKASQPSDVSNNKRPAAPPMAKIAPGAVPAYLAKSSTTPMVAPSPRAPVRKPQPAPRAPRVPKLQKGPSNLEKILEIAVTAASDPPKQIAGRQEAKYFILKSFNETNIEISVSRGIWCCKKVNNSRLSQAFNSANGPIFLIFSVNGSRKFCGVAEMKSPWKAEYTTVQWDDGIWQGGFRVEWLTRAIVRFDDVSHLPLAEGGRPITTGKNVPEVCPSTGAEMLRRFGLSHRIPTHPGQGSPETKRKQPMQPIPSSLPKRSVLLTPEPLSPRVRIGNAAIKIDIDRRALATDSGQKSTPVFSANPNVASHKGKEPVRPGSVLGKRPLKDELEEEKKRAKKNSAWTTENG